MITIGEIAEQAGVSKATVSRVINSSGYVSDDTRRKIEEVIDAHQYSPSAVAQNLSKKTSQTIGVIVPELENTFYSEVLSGVAEIVDQNNLTMIVCDTNNDEAKESKALQIMEQQRVCGVVFSPASGYSDAQAAKHIRLQLRDLHLPVVLVDREIENVSLDGVFYENFQSGYLATEHLIKAGKKKIGMIVGDLELKHGRDRYKGFVQAMEDYNLPVLEKYIYPGQFSMEETYRVTKEMLRSGDYPEGLVLSNNLTTLGFIRGLQESDRVSDEDIQFVGIDHIPVLDLIGYRYDCVTRDMKEMGRTAMQLLIKRMEEPERKQEIHFVPCIAKFIA